SRSGSAAAPSNEAHRRAARLACLRQSPSKPSSKIASPGARTVTLTGTWISDGIGPLVARHTWVVYWPGLRFVASTRTTRSRAAPASTEPVVGDTCSHGLAVGLAQPMPDAAGARCGAI